MHDMYKVSSEDDSNPNRAYKRKLSKSMGLFGTIIFIYIPTILFVLIARALMVYNGKHYVYLGVVDQFLLECAKDFMNYYATRSGV